MTTLQFTDRTVTYSQFINDLGIRTAEVMMEVQKKPVLSQREANAEFGTANVRRWEEQGKLHPAKRVGKYEYQRIELLKCQSTKQDYFK